MTWNIHGGVGPDRKHDLARIIALIESHSPDVIALQEIDSRRGRGKPVLPLDYLAEALGAHTAECRTIVSHDGHYGHAIISRWPLKNIVVHDISFGRWERRNVIEADVATPFGQVNVSAVHLGLWFAERRHQAAKLAQIAASQHPVSIMMGDFNDWMWGGPVRRALADVLPGITEHRTFPSRWPLLLLDRIYCRPRAALLSSWTDPDGRRASDHLPVIADIALPKAGSGT